MNVTFNSETVSLLIQEVDDILSHVEITPGMTDDFSSFLNALMNIAKTGSIVIVHNDDNIGDDWDDGDDSPPLVPTGWDLIDA